MFKQKLIMGMPIGLEIADEKADESAFKSVFDFFKKVDSIFSTYKKNSEISRINRGELKIENASKDVQLILKLAEEAKKETLGYFDIYNSGNLDPSGIVKGWAIYKSAKLLKNKGFKNFCIDAGGDVEISGLNENGEIWKVGIRNPFNIKEIIKVLSLTNCGIATSGTYERGQHVWNPVEHKTQNEIVSLTVVGPNVYEADKFATAAFAMGEKGIHFLESKKNFEGYMINKEGIATMTSGFEKYA